MPWLLAGARLGNHVLEVGAGYGAATGQLAKMVPRLTSLEYDLGSLKKLRKRNPQPIVQPVCGDAVQLPFPENTFSSAIAVLVLHHLKDKALQDRAFAEVHRVLQPGASFYLFEIEDSWIHRLSHFRSTFQPLSPGSTFSRLGSAGFDRISVDFRPGGFRVSARKEANTGLTEKAFAASSAGR